MRSAGCATGPALDSCAILCLDSPVMDTTGALDANGVRASIAHQLAAQHRRSSIERNGWLSACYHVLLSKHVSEERVAHSLSPPTVDPNVQVERANLTAEMHWLALLCKLLERRLTARLRFDAGRVYTVSVDLFFGLEAPSRVESKRGDVAVSFTCGPGEGKALAQAVLDEMERLQVHSTSFQCLYWHGCLAAHL